MSKDFKILTPEERHELATAPFARPSVVTSHYAIGSSRGRYNPDSRFFKVSDIPAGQISQFIASGNTTDFIGK